MGCNCGSSYKSRALRQVQKASKQSSVPSSSLAKVKLSLEEAAPLSVEKSVKPRRRGFRLDKVRS